MAAQFTQTYKAVPGQDYMAVGNLQCDNNYQAPGYALTPAMFGFTSRIDAVVPIVSGANYQAEWDIANQALRMEQDPGSGLAQVPNATDLSAVKVVLIVFGL